MESGYILSGRYKIVSTLGEGGMANVYCAYDLILKRYVAVKLLRLDMRDDPTAVRRFQGEAMSLTELTDPHIVMLYDIGEESGLQYLVMEYVKGMDLKQYIKQEYPFSLKRVVQIMQQILQAVSDAHRHGIIHRDLKPQNILIDQNGNVKITDFGIALALERSTMTKTNTVMGSVHYISPEQARGSIVTKQTDIYSLGIILFEMLTGHVPYRGENAVSIIMKHYQEAMPSVRDERSEIPQPLENIVLHATAKDLENRYATVEEMASDLETCLSKDRQQEPRWEPVFQNNEETKVLAQKNAENTIGNSKLTADSEEQPDPSAASKPSKGRKKWSRKKKWTLIFALLLVFLLGSGGIAYAVIPQDTTVPQLRGMTASEASDSLHKSNLKLGKVQKAYSETYYFGQIIKSKPQAKSEITEGSKVNVVVSKGPKKEKFGDYTGQKYSVVRKMLKKRGVSVQQEKVYSTTVAKGEIKSQSISAKKKVVMNDTSVTFKVSRGSRSFELRDLSNYTLKSAQDYADERGLTLNVSHRDSDDYDEGIVMAQEPRAGTSLEQGASVSVTISNGPANESSESSSSSSASSSSSQESSQNFDVSVKVPFNGNNNKKSNTVQVYLEDQNHHLNDVYQTLNITKDQTVRLSFVLDQGEKGAYKIVRDGQTITQKNDVTH